MNTRINYLVSICVPVYKVEEYIERCSRSLFEQTYENIEFVFIDDCSPDNSIAILQQIVELYPKRKNQIRIIRHETNSGLGIARNTAVREAKGDFILHVDSDDYISTDAVERLVAKQKETNADIVKYPKKILYKSSTQIEDLSEYSSPRKLLEDIFIGKVAGNVCGGLIRTSLYHDNGIHVEGGVNQSEDFQVIPRLLFFAQKIAVVHNVFYFYDCTSEDSYSNNLSWKSYQQIDISLWLLNDFLVQRNEIYLCGQLWKGRLISLCRIKIRFCNTNNKKMYDFICSLIEQYKSNLTDKMPYKYRLLMSCKNYQLFKVLILFKNLTKI